MRASLRARGDGASRRRLSIITGTIGKAASHLSERPRSEPLQLWRCAADSSTSAQRAAYLDTLPPGPRNFGPEARRSPMDDQGMGGRMRDMMGGGLAALWVVIVVLAAALAGVIGYLIGQRRR